MTDIIPKEWNNDRYYTREGVGVYSLTNSKI